MTRQQREYEWASAESPASVRYILPTVLRYLHDTPPSALVLDAGCGNGIVLGSLSHRGWRLHGIEISQSGLAQAARAHPEIAFERADLASDLSAHGLWEKCDTLSASKSWNTFSCRETSPVTVTDS